MVYLIISNKMVRINCIEDLLRFERIAHSEFELNPTLARSLRNLEYYYLGRAKISYGIDEGTIKGELSPRSKQLMRDLATGFYNSVINIYDLTFNRRKVIDPTGNFYIINSIQDLNALEQKSASEFRENPTLGQALLNFEYYFNARRIISAKIKKGEIKDEMPPWSKQFVGDLFMGYSTTIDSFLDLIEKWFKKRLKIT